MTPAAALNDKLERVFGVTEFVAEMLKAIRFTDAAFGLSLKESVILSSQFGPLEIGFAKVSPFAPRK